MGPIPFPTVSQPELVFSQQTTRHTRASMHTKHFLLEPGVVQGLGSAAQSWTQGQLVPSFCRCDLASFSRLP